MRGCARRRPCGAASEEGDADDQIGFLCAPDSVDAGVAHRNTGEESDPAVRRLRSRAAA